MDGCSDEGKSCGDEESGDEKMGEDGEREREMLETRSYD